MNSNLATTESVGLSNPGRPSLLAFSLVLGLFFLLVRGASEWLATGDEMLAIWPANGLLLGYLLARPTLGPRWALAAGLLANVLARMLAGEETALALVLGTIDIFEIALALFLAHRHFGPAAQPDLRETAALIFFLGRVCLPASAAAAFLTAGYLSIWATAPFAMTLILNWLAGFLGLAVIGVLTVELLHPAFLASDKLLSRLARLGLVVAATSAIAWLIFSQTRYPLLYLFGAVMMAAAYGTGLRGATTGILSVAAVATWLTAAGSGPLALIPDSSADERLLVLQIFLLVGAFIILPFTSVLSAVVRQRIEAQKVLDKMSAIMTTVPIGITFTRDRKFELVGSTFESMFGYPKGALIGQSPRIIYESDLFYQELGARVAAAFESKQPFVEEIPMVRQDGSRFWGLIKGAPVRPSDASAGTIWTIEDVTDLREKRERLSWTSTHDPLTELVNRREFEARLADWMQRLDRQQTAASLFIDLDRFKLVNDSGGHAAGDQILKDVAKILNDSVRHGDTVARLGGDEFAVLLPECSIEVGERIANKICSAVEAHRLQWEGQELSVGASVGLIEIDARHADVAAVIAAADAACYEAKRAGRNTVKRG